MEHGAVLRHLNCKTFIDIGANRGQFALAVRHYFPDAILVSFEPLPGPASVFQTLFAKDSRTVLHNVAIGPRREHATMHVSGHDDSSSLLPISPLQNELFTGTAEVTTTVVKVAPLDTFLTEDDILPPAMLKLDVQGFELDALAGCESLLTRFDWVYCECSFLELYSGQKLAGEVVNWLARRGYELAGIFSPQCDSEGMIVQADFLFRRTGSTHSSRPVADH